MLSVAIWIFSIISAAILSILLTKFSKKDFLKNRLFIPIVYTLIFLIFIIMVVTYVNNSPDLILGDAAMTTIMYHTLYKPAIFSNDVTYNKPIELYPRLFLYLRNVFDNIADGDTLGGARLMFILLLILKAPILFYLFYKITDDLHLSFFAGFCALGFVTLPDSIHYGFYNIGQLNNRNLYHLFYPLIYIIYLKNNHVHKYLLLAFLVGLLGNFHPTESLVSYMILSILIAFDWRYEGMKIRKIFLKISYSFPLWILGILPQILRMLSTRFPAGSEQITTSELSTFSEIRGWVTYLPQRVLYDYFSHSVFLSFIVILIIITAIYKKSSFRDYWKKLRHSKFNKSDGSSLNSSNRLMFSSIIIMISIPFLSFIIGFIFSRFYYFLTGSITTMSLLFRISYSFQFLFHIIFILILNKIKDFGFSERQKYFLYILGLVGMLTSYSHPYDLPFIRTPEMYAGKILLNILIIGAFGLVYYLFRRFKTDSIKFILFPLMFFVSFPSNGIMVVLKTGYKTIIVGNATNDLAELVSWAKGNTDVGETFWCNTGKLDYQFKANALRPTTPNLQTTETVWFTKGVKAALKSWKEFGDLSKSLGSSDFEKMDEFIRKYNVKYILIQKSKSPNLVALENTYETLYENSEYIALNAIIPVTTNQ